MMWDRVSGCFLSSCLIVIPILLRSSPASVFFVLLLPPSFSFYLLSSSFTRLPVCCCWNTDHYIALLERPQASILSCSFLCSPSPSLHPTHFARWKCQERKRLYQTGKILTTHLNGVCVFHLGFCKMLCESVPVHVCVFILALWLRTTCLFFVFCFLSTLWGCWMFYSPCPSWRVCTSWTPAGVCI